MAFMLKRSVSVDVGREVEEMIEMESGVLLRPP